MKNEKLIIVVLVVLALMGITWSIIYFINSNNSEKMTKKYTSEDFMEFVAAELPDKCQTPEGYTEEEWREHMSHHPDRYTECLGEVEPADLVKHIDPDDLATMLKTKDFELIDVHIPEQSHIPNTDQFIPFDEIKEHLNDLPQDKNEKIVLYCRSGSMSRIASKDLVEMGYTNVYNLVGGINGWKQMGYEVEDISL